MSLAVVLGANGFIGRHVAQAMSGWPEIEVVGAGLGTPLPGLERRWLDIDLLAGDGRLAAELRAMDPRLVVNCTGATAGTAAELTRLWRPSPDPASEPGLSTSDRPPSMGRVRRAIPSPRRRRRGR